MVQRLKKLRKEYLKLSQTEFGKQLGVSRDVIKNLELSCVEIKDYMVNLICQTFNVNEDWLRNGNEPIFIEKTDDILEQFLEEFELGDVAKDIIRSYIKLPKEEQRMFENFVAKLFKQMQEEEKQNNSHKAEVVENTCENSKNEEITNINEFKKQQEPKQEQELVKIIARGEGITYITKEEFEELKRNSTMLDPEDYDKYF